MSNKMLSIAIIQFDTARVAVNNEIISRNAEVKGS